MARWEVTYPIEYTSDGDLTREAIWKTKKEFEKIYEHMNSLRNYAVSSSPPENPENYDVWLNYATMELMTFIEGSGWVSVIRVRGSDFADDAGRLGGISSAGYAKQNAFQDLFDLVQAMDSVSTEALNELRAYVDTQLANTLKDDLFVFKGPWQDGGLYVPYNVVEYGGSSYVLKSGNGLAPPPGEHWQMVAAAGKDSQLDVIDGGRADTVFTLSISGGNANSRLEPITP